MLRSAIIPSTVLVLCRRLEQPASTVRVDGQLQLAQPVKLILRCSTLSKGTPFANSV